MIVYIYMYTCANGQRMTLYTADTQETVSSKQVLTCRKLSSFQHQFDLKRKRKIQLTSHKHNFPIPSTRRFHGYTVDTEKQCQTNNFTMSKTTQTQIFDNKSQISMSPSKQQVVFINVCRWLKCMCLHPKVFARGLLPVIVGMRRSVTEETKDFLQSNKTKKQQRQPNQNTKSNPKQKNQRAQEILQIYRRFFLHALELIRCETNAGSRPRSSQVSCEHSFSLF